MCCIFSRSYTVNNRRKVLTGLSGRHIYLTLPCLDKLRWDPSPWSQEKERFLRREEKWSEDRAGHVLARVLIKSSDQCSKAEVEHHSTKTAPLSILCRESHATPPPPLLTIDNQPMPNLVPRERCPTGLERTDHGNKWQVNRFFGGKLFPVNPVLFCRMCK